MYKKLDSEYSKRRFSEILQETQEIAENKLTEAENSLIQDLWISIISQIKDIREKIVEKHILNDWEEIYERYSIGMFGLQYFSEKDEMRSRLCDIFEGAVHYRELKD